MRKITIVLFLLISLFSNAQTTTYIPRYKSFVQITYKGDTITNDNVYRSLDVESVDGQFKISVQHEDVTREKVNAIKRAKAAAGWATFNSVMAVSVPGNRGSMFSHVQDIKLSAMLAEIANDNATAEEKLEIEAWIENLTNDELLVADLDRGNVWYIQPHQTLAVGLPNPCETMLRISDIHSQNISFTTIAAGSVVKKETIAWQDAKCWIIEVTKKQQRPTQDKEIIGYMHVNKETFENIWMSYNDFEAFKKNKKLPRQSRE